MKWFIGRERPSSLIFERERPRFSNFLEKTAVCCIYPWFYLGGNQIYLCN